LTRTLRARACAALALCLACALATPAAAQQTESDEERAKRNAAKLTKAPKLIQSAEAAYPQEAIDKKVEGAVKLRLGLDAAGKVIKVELLEDPGAGLGDAARIAAEQFVFEPAEINGQPAPISLTFTINFALPTQPGAFKGAVTDAGSNKPLVGVKVSVRYTGPETLDPAPQAATTTDDKGNFSFENMPGGQYAVRLEIDQYQQFDTTIEVKPGQTSEAAYKAQAQPVTFKGTVREAGTRKILSGMRVEVNDAAGKLVREEYTDGGGKFAVRGLPTGKYAVRVGAKGYIALQVEEAVKDGEVLEVLYAVEAEYYDEYTVRTSATRERREVSRQTLRLEEVRKIPGTQGDVVRVIQNLPGVARAPFVSGSVIVRGSAPRDTQTFLNGDNIPLVYHFFAGPAVINSEMIESIDFYPGNFSVQYGRATGGIINLNTRSPRTDGFHGNAELDLLDATLLIEGPITENLSFAISGRRSYYDVFLGLVIPEDTVDVVAAPYYYDYQAWLTYKGFPDHKLELFAYGSYDRVELILPPGDPQGNTDVVVSGLNLDNGFYRGQFNWEWTPAGPVSNRLMVSYGLNTAGFEAAENLFFIADAYQTQLREEMTIRASEQVKLRLGADFQLANITYRFEIPRFGADATGNNNSGTGDGTGQRPNFSPGGALGSRDTALTLPAFWSELDAEVLPGLRLIPGLRLDYFGNISEPALSPRLTARWDLNKEVVVKGGVGRFVQPPLPGATEPLFGNPDLTYERSQQYALGAEWRPEPFLEFDVTGFYRTLDTIVSTTSDFFINEDGQAQPRVFNNEGEGRAYGLEVLLRHYPQKRFFGWLAYTLSKAERRNIETGEWQNFRFDQTHILTAVAGYKLPYNFDVSARYRLVTGNPVTPVVGSVYDSDRGRFEQVFGKPFSARNSPFSQLDIRIDKAFIYESWTLGLFLDILNVTYADNAEGVRYNYDFTESAPVSGLPIIPTLGVSAKW
jgi:TonB family protein